MYRTIKLGSCVSVQGKVVRVLNDGRLIVRVGRKFFTGHAVSADNRPTAPEQKRSA